MIKSITAFDFSVLDFIRENIANPALNVIMTIITYSGEFGAVWIAAAIACLCFKKTRKAGVAMAVALIIGGLFGSIIIKNVIARPRPFTANPDIQLIIPPPTSFSFPSGHTLASFGAASALFIQHRRLGAAALIYAALVGFSRLYMYVHYPTDVLAGCILGILLGTFSWLAVKKFYAPCAEKISAIINKKSSLDN